MSVPSECTKWTSTDMDVELTAWWLLAIWRQNFVDVWRNGYRWCSCGLWLLLWLLSDGWSPFGLQEFPALSFPVAWGTAEKTTLVLLCPGLALWLRVLALVLWPPSTTSRTERFSGWRSPTLGLLLLLWPTHLPKYRWSVLGVAVLSRIDSWNIQTR